MENAAQNSGIPSSEKSAEADAGSELLPCPFCPDGGSPYVFDGFVAEGSRVVECHKCGSRGTLYGSDGPVGNRRRAIQAWNTRATGTEKENDGKRIHR